MRVNFRRLDSLRVSGDGYCTGEFWDMDQFSTRGKLDNMSLIKVILNIAHDHPVPCFITESEEHSVIWPELQHECVTEEGRERFLSFSMDDTVLLSSLSVCVHLFLPSCCAGLSRSLSEVHSSSACKCFHLGAQPH